MDSPRGRIILMKSVLEGDLAIDETMTYIDRCLGCQACVPACPSGVEYGQLLSAFRDYAETRRQRGSLDRARRWLVQEILPYKGRFRAVASLGKLAFPARQVFPTKVRIMLELLPARIPVSQPLPGIYPAQGERRARVALLVGCVQPVLAPEIHWATLRVLSLNGVETIIPDDQGCCGALSIHNGNAKRARAFARQLLKAFPSDVDAVVTNTAGCGSGIKEYGLLFEGTPEEEQASQLASKVRDASEFLFELGIQPPPAWPQPFKIAYHDACHLAYAQGVIAAPRSLLQAIPNVSLVEVSHGEMCCGSAGSYNLEQPEIAGKLGQQKAENIINSGAEAVVMGNIGCMVQVHTHLQKLGQQLPVYHTLELLELAYSRATGV